MLQSINDDFKGRWIKILRRFIHVGIGRWFALPLVGTIMGAAIYSSRFVCGSFRFVRFREAFARQSRAGNRAAVGPFRPLQAFMTALAATIGTGNIAGVATAIVSGGPGALFWIWCYGFFAMSTKFAEASLGMHFRVARGEDVLSGPMYYLRDGLKSPCAGLDFCVRGRAGRAVHDADDATEFGRQRDGSQLKEHSLSIEARAKGTLSWIAIT